MSTTQCTLPPFPTRGSQKRASLKPPSRPIRRHQRLLPPSTLRPGPVGTAIAGYLDVTGVSNSPLWEYQFVNDFLGTVPHRQGLTTEWVGVNPDMRRAGNTASSPSEDIHGTSLGRASHAATTRA